MPGMQKEIAEVEAATLLDRIFDDPNIYPDNRRGIDYQQAVLADANFDVFLD